MSKSNCVRVLAILALTLETPAWALDIIPPKVETMTPSGVSIIDAAFAYSVTDLSIGPLTLTRYHVVGKLKPSTLIGSNMSHNFDIYVNANNKTAKGGAVTISPIVHIGQSASGTYSQSNGIPYSIGPDNDDAVRSGNLTLIGGGTPSAHYVYTDRDGVVYTFTNAVPAVLGYISERVSQIAFPDGRIQTFSYNASNQLKLVTDSSGYAIVFDYNSAGMTSAACGFNLSQDYVTASSTCANAALKVGYGYDASNNLISATAVDGQVTAYPGNTRNSLTCVQPPGYSSCKVAITYTTFPGYTATTQTLLGGGTWTINGVAPEVINDPSYDAVTDGDSTASFTDPAGKTTSFTFTKSSPVTMTDPLGRTTKYHFVGGLSYVYTGTPYHEGTMLIEADMPEGDKYLAEYNGPDFSISKETMVAKPGSGLADLVKEYGYSCLGYILSPTCTKPVWIKDPKGSQTDIAYASFGGVTSEMQPAPAAGAARPLKVYTYVQKYAYVMNAGGTLVAAAAPIWVADTMTECQTVAGSGTPTCDAAAPQRVTSYEYGANGTANNLLVRGIVVTANGTSLRTCMSYDARGRKISTTAPRAGLAVCP